VRTCAHVGSAVVYERTAELFATPASPRRLALVQRLAASPATVGDLADALAHERESDTA